MTIAITPHRCAAVYDMLREFQVIGALKLPPADEIEFHVRQVKGYYGWYMSPTMTTDHAITVSQASIGHLTTLETTIAHEMVHLYQARAGTRTKSIHNAEFRRIGRRVCKELGWDEKAF
jgi:predicted SprT family Zn-dependent metalloprotease